jgi:putative tricarboxylic transport membrane protein
MTPQTLPRIAVVAALGLIAVVIGRAKVSGGAKAIGKPLLLIAALGVHAVALPVVGFIPASAVLFVIAARLMGSRRVAIDLAIGVAGATLLFFVFTRGLGLSL